MCNKMINWFLIISYQSPNHPLSCFLLNLPSKLLLYPGFHHQHPFPLLVIEPTISWYRPGHIPSILYSSWRFTCIPHTISRRRPRTRNWIIIDVDIPPSLALHPRFYHTLVILLHPWSFHLHAVHDHSTENWLMNDTASPCPWLPSLSL